MYSKPLCHHMGEHVSLIQCTTGQEAVEGPEYVKAFCENYVRNTHLMTVRISFGWNRDVSDHVMRPVISFIKTWSQRGASNFQMDVFKWKVKSKRQSGLTSVPFLIPFSFSVQRNAALQWWGAGIAQVVKAWICNIRIAGSSLTADGMFCWYGPHTPHC